MVFVLSGGILANSLAIATDAAHLLTDVASFMISLFSIYLASRPATKRMSFGWYRAGLFLQSVFTVNNYICHKLAIVLQLMLSNI